MFAPHLKPFGNKKLASKREDQWKLQNKKKQIEDLLKNEMGLLVNNVTAGSSRMSDDRNTAGRFF